MAAGMYKAFVASGVPPVARKSVVDALVNFKPNLSYVLLRRRYIACLNYPSLD